MENVEGLSNEELKELIQEHLREMCIDIDTVEVSILEGPRVLLSGKVNASGERELIKQVIMDVVGIDDIDDELIVIQGVRGEFEEELDEHEEGDLYDQDDEYVGTEDVFRSVEDGVPYIPPTSPTFQEPAEDRKSKKKKKKR